ncbi:MAG: hypothetical protein ACREA0_01300, partial [bacterium]
MTDQASMDALPAPLLREGWVHRDGILTSSDFIRTDPENYPEELREWLASVEPRHAWFRVRAEPASAKTSPCERFASPDGLRAAAGYVKPGGLVIVTVPAHPWLWSSVDVASGHQRRYRRRRLISTLRSAGLVVECCQPFFFSLVPVLAARRLASER